MLLNLMFSKKWVIVSKNNNYFILTKHFSTKFGNLEFA